jgi:hypothetical protein
MSKATSCWHTRFPSPHLSGQIHVCKWSCPAWRQVASERAKLTLWLAAATKLVCPLLPGHSCGVGGGGSDKEPCSDCLEKECDNGHLQVVDEHFTSSVEPAREKR